jgi:hypothetical protein
LRPYSGISILLRDVLYCMKKRSQVIKKAEKHSSEHYSNRSNKR